MLGDLHIGGQETQHALELVLERNTQRLISSFKWWLKIWARRAWQWNNYLVFCLPNVRSELQRPDAVLLEQLAFPLLSAAWSQKHQLKSFAATAPHQVGTDRLLSSGTPFLPSWGAWDWAPFLPCAPSHTPWQFLPAGAGGKMATERFCPTTLSHMKDACWVSFCFQSTGFWNACWKCRQFYLLLLL